MILTITTTRSPATDLGFLLHKHPDRVQTFDLPFGQAHVFYPETSEHRCTIALLVDVDPILLVRKHSGKPDAAGPLAQYVNDRPYAASSFSSVALSRVFGTAMSGACKAKPDLVSEAMPFEVMIAVLPARGGPKVLQRLFEPLGYEIEATRHPLDAVHPEWGDSAYYTVCMRTCTTLKTLLSHLYVLIPVLDDAKHYFIGDDEVEKLLRHGSSWLATHPARDEIALRYLRRQRGLARIALERLVAEDAPDDADDSVAAKRDSEEEALERPLRLNDLRMRVVASKLQEVGATRVLDLGCGEGRLLQELLRKKQFARIVGMDAALRSLDRAQERLHMEDMAPKMRERIELLHGSLMYRDRRLEGFDAAALVEVIEHVDTSRLDVLEHAVFTCAAPKFVLVTTPNREYNVRFASLPAGKLRHSDHRFEWTRSEFALWASGVADRNGYTVAFEGIGEIDDEVGTPTQMAVFTKSGLHRDGN